METSTLQLFILLGVGACLAALYHWVSAHPNDENAKALRQYLRGYPIVQAVALDIGCAILAIVILKRLLSGQ